MTRWDVKIRSARSSDIPAIHILYAREVREHVSTFELEPPTESELEELRVSVHQAGLPYLVAETDRLVGFAYAAPYRRRRAYRFTVENSVYVDRGAQGQGVGGALLQEIIRGCTEAGYRQMIAVIADPGRTGSVRLHTRLGFREVGLLKEVGEKFGRRLDTLIMQRELG